MINIDKKFERLSEDELEYARHCMKEHGSTKEEVLTALKLLEEDERLAELTGVDVDADDISNVADEIETTLLSNEQIEQLNSAYRIWEANEPEEIKELQNRNHLYLTDEPQELEERRARAMLKIKAFREIKMGNVKSGNSSELIDEILKVGMNKLAF